MLKFLVSECKKRNNYTDLDKHYSGFVNIIGKPNVGKSTLLNALMGEKMSIITHKPQTTRHRILGIISDEHYQIIFSDTPGVIEDPEYKMQKAMNDAAMSIFEDADLVLFVTEPADKYEGDEQIIEKLKKCEIPKFLIINKVDTADPPTLKELESLWMSRVDFDNSIFVSALNKLGTEHLLQCIIESLPEGPVYYPKDQASDKSVRFFVSEIIREKILLQYKQEIPYSCEVVVTEYKEGEKHSKPLVRIRAEIYVMRQSQKQILIGKAGSSIKNLGISARKDIEAFIDKRVHLELYVKVKEKWRDDDNLLKSFGYLH
jgi:GTP-binding protein Era